MPTLSDNHNKVTLKKIQEYLDLKSTNTKEQLFDIYTKEEIEELEKSSKKIAEMMANFQPHLTIAKTLVETIQIPDFSSALAPVIGVQNAVSIFKIETNSMLKWMRATDNMFVNLSYQLKSINKLFMDAFAPIKWLSEVMQQNANVIKNMARAIENATQPTLLKGILEIPQYPLFDALSILETQRNELQKDYTVLIPTDTSPNTPIAVEKREIQVLTGDGFVYAAFSRRRNINSIEELNKAYFEVTGQSPNLIAANTSQQEIELTIEDRQIGKSKMSIIKATNLGASKPINPKNNGWLAAFRTYIENYGSVDEKHVLQEYYSAIKDKGVSGPFGSSKDKIAISQIHYQIKEGLKRTFPDLVQCISFSKVKNGYDKGRHLLKIEKVVNSTLVN